MEPCRGLAAEVGQAGRTGQVGRWEALLLAPAVRMAPSSLAGPWDLAPPAQMAPSSLAGLCDLASPSNLAGPSDLANPSDFGDPLGQTWAGSARVQVGLGALTRCADRAYLEDRAFREDRPLQACSTGPFQCPAQNLGRERECHLVIQKAGAWHQGVLPAETEGTADPVDAHKPWREGSNGLWGLLCSATWGYP